MKIFLSPQVSYKSNFEYSFKSEKLHIECDGVADEFDFTGLPDGRIQMFDENGDILVETKFEINPLISAKKKDGVLYLTLLNMIGENATEEERFPEWIDADDYVFKENPDSIVKEEEDGEVELEESEGN